MFHQLALVVAVDEELNILCQGLDSAGEATRSTSEALEVMTKVCIDSFHRTGFLFIGAHLIRSAIVEGVIDRKGIRVILFGLWCSFQANLQSFRGSLLHHIPTQHATSVSIHNG